MSMIPMTPSAATPQQHYFPSSFDSCESCPGPSAAIETMAQFGFILPKEAFLAIYSCIQQFLQSSLSSAPPPKWRICFAPLQICVNHALDCKLSPSPRDIYPHGRGSSSRRIEGPDRELAPRQRPPFIAIHAQ